VFIEEKNEHGEQAAWNFANTVLNLTLAGCAVMMLVVYAYAEPITSTLVGGFEEESRALGIKLLKWIMPGAALMVLYLPMRAILNSYKVFGYPAAAEATQKLVWAVGLFVTYRFLHLGIQAVAMGFLVGSVGMIAVTMFGMRRHVGLYRPGLPAMATGRVLKEALICAAFLGGTVGALALLGNLISPDFRYRALILMTVTLCAVIAFTGQLWLRARKRSGTMALFAALAAPLLVSTMFAAYRDVVTFYFQSFTARGVFSDIEYARRIAFVPTTMVAYALSVAMFPYLCELASKKDEATLGRVVSKALRMLALGFVPLTVMTVILADPVARLVLDRGDWAAVHLRYTALALAMLALGLIMYAWEYVITQAYFSVKRMWTPALMGIAATFFQFAFLAVPIYVLGYGYPVHIFFLTALAYPVSRYFKNIILLGLLAKRLPVLPARESLVFGAKLAVLSVAVGLATWGAHEVVRRRLPYDKYRQHKVVVDNFETGPDSWFSLNAQDISIAQAPGQGQGLAVRMQYDRHGATPCSLYRELKGMRAATPVLVEFSLYSEGPMDGIAVEVERNGSRSRVFEERFAAGTQPTGQWQHFLCEISEPQPIERIHWLETKSALNTTNAFYIDNILLKSPTWLWGEDFDRNGWQGAPGSSAQPWVGSEVSAGEKSCALALPEGTCSKALMGLDLSGVERFRYRLLNTGPSDAEVSVTLTGAGETGVSHRVSLRPGEWQRTDLSWQDLGLPSPEEFASLNDVRVEASQPGVYLDDVTFRRPPSRMYEVYKLAHCTVPTLAGLLVAILCLLVLRFDEMRDVGRWIKKRGWRRRKEDGEDVVSEQS